MGKIPFAPKVSTERDDSDYVLVVDREVEEESGTEETAQPGARMRIAPGQPRRLWWFIVIGILVIGIGAGIFFVVKKKGDDDWRHPEVVNEVTELISGCDRKTAEIMERQLWKDGY